MGNATFVGFCRIFQNVQLEKEQIFKQHFVSFSFHKSFLFIIFASEFLLFCLWPVLSSPVLRTDSDKICVLGPQSWFWICSVVYNANYSNSSCKQVRQKDLKDNGLLTVYLIIVLSWPGKAFQPVKWRILERSHGRFSFLFHFKNILLVSLWCEGDITL